MHAVEPSIDEGYNIVIMSEMVTFLPSTGTLQTDSGLDSIEQHFQEKNLSKQTCGWKIILCSMNMQCMYYMCPIGHY